MDSERSQFSGAVTSLRNLAAATSVYKKLEGATISSDIIKGGLWRAHWGLTKAITYITRPMAFSCIAMMETGSLNIPPSQLQNVIAISSGNSLFVTSVLLSDPTCSRENASISRITGNVGRPGINFLMLPSSQPLVRPLSRSYRAVSYSPFDGKTEDNFRATTLHMSFTKYEFPLGDRTTGLIDRPGFFVEAVISVYDGGQWVADLDVKHLTDKDVIQKMASRGLHHDPDGRCAPEQLSRVIQKHFTSIDSWEEILDTPPGIGLIRAHGNWPARLAAAAFLAQRLRHRDHCSDHDTSAGDSGQQPSFALIQSNSDVCWACLYRRVRRTAPHGSDAPFFVIY